MVRSMLAALGLFALGCGGGGGDDNPDVPDAKPPDTLPTTPPAGVRRVTNEGFHTPTDAVASPDGKTFYFAALTNDTPAETALFSVPASGGAPTRLHAGAPLSYVTGLVLGCDGDTLYAADMGDAAAEPDAADAGALFSISTSGGSPTRLTADGVGVPSGLAMDRDCETLVVSGRNTDGQPALLRLAATGGAATTVAAGPPLVAPTGVHIDSDGVSWVMDHQAGEAGSGALFAIDAAGAATLRADNLQMGTPGGVSLTAGGGTALIATRDRETGAGALVAVDLATDTRTVITGDGLVEPAGLRTARGAGVFAVADSESDAIFAAE